MNLIYAPSYRKAHDFAQHNEFAPGDWLWIRDKSVVHDHLHADVFKAPNWQRHPFRADIDKALDRAAHQRRLGTVTDLSSSFGTLGVSDA